MVAPRDASPALEVRGLKKDYRFGHIVRRSRTVLHGIDFQVRQGEVFGYLGPNGSGKTTTIKVVVGLTPPDAGDVVILGHPHSRREWRERVGFLPENPYFYDYLTAEEYLDYVGRLFGLSRALRRERVQALLHRLGLAASRGVPLRRFSKGMLQKVGLGQALINDPELVVLDEPMSGLDPIGRRLVRDLVVELRGRGKTVFFSTHILSDAETLCDRVAVLRSGRLIDVGPLTRILQIDVEHMEVLVSGLPEGAEMSGPGIQACQRLGERWRLEVEERALGAVIGRVETAGGRILSVLPIRQSLEDYFIKEVGTAEERGQAWDG
jgi:ABC-2 type transport system ATP-binding protein